MLRSLPLTLCVVALCCGSPVAQATTALHPDRDNTLYEEGFASNGAGTRMFAGFRIGGSRRRAVTRFDVAAAIPPGSTILTAELEVTCVMTIVGSFAHTVHRVTADWGEGTSFGSSGQGGGATPTPGDTTWTERMHPGVLWTTPGGDFVPTVSSSTVVGAADQTYTFGSTPELVADVQAWLDAPASNFGWILIGAENLPGEFATAKAFATREDAAKAPVLTVTYDPPATALAYGTSCAVSSPPLVLSAQGAPVVGATGFALAVSGGAPGLGAADCVFARAGLSTPLPVLGCELWLDPARLIPACIPFGPTGLLPIGLPNDAALSGQAYFAQAVAIESGTMQLVTSNGIEIRIGR